MGECYLLEGIGTKGHVRGMSEGLKTCPPVDLRSRFCAFVVVTAPLFVRRWVLRGGLLVILSNPVHIMLNMGLIDTLKFFLLNDSFLG